VWFPLSTPISLVLRRWGGGAGASKLIIIPASLNDSVRNDRGFEMPRASWHRIFCAGFWCARFTFITFAAVKLKAATSKPRRVIDLKKFVSRGDLDPIY